MVMRAIPKLERETVLAILGLIHSPFIGAALTLNTYIEYTIPNIGPFVESFKELSTREFDALKNILAAPEMKVTKFRANFQGGTLEVNMLSREIKVRGEILTKRDFIQAGLSKDKHGDLRIQYDEIWYNEDT